MIWSTALAYGAFGCFATAMPRHGPALAARPLGDGARRRLRTAGWLLLALSLLPVLASHRWRIDLMTWIGLLALVALMVTLVTGYRPQLLRWTVIGVLGVAALVETFGWRWP